jgi:hypothetical protein
LSGRAKARPTIRAIFEEITDLWKRKAEGPDRDGHDGSRRHRR